MDTDGIPPDLRRKSVSHMISPLWMCIPYIIGLVWGKIYRKPWFLPSNIGLSCNFSHHPILWIYLYNIIMYISIDYIYTTYVAHIYHTSPWCYYSTKSTNSFSTRPSAWKNGMSCSAADRDFCLRSARAFSSCRIPAKMMVIWAAKHGDLPGKNWHLTTRNDDFWQMENYEKNNIWM